MCALLLFYFLAVSLLAFHVCCVRVAVPQLQEAALTIAQKELDVRKMTTAEIHSLLCLKTAADPVTNSVSYCALSLSLSLWLRAC